MIFDNMNLEQQERVVEEDQMSFVCSIDEDMHQNAEKIKKKDFSDYYDVCRVEINVDFLIGGLEQKSKETEEPRTPLESIGSSSEVPSQSELPSEQGQRDQSCGTIHQSFELPEISKRFIVKPVVREKNCIRSSDINSHPKSTTGKRKGLKRKVDQSDSKSKMRYKIKSFTFIPAARSLSFWKVMHSPVACFFCRKEFEWKQKLAKIKACEHLFHLSCLEDFLKDTKEDYSLSCPKC